MGKAIREGSFGKRMVKVPNWECLFVNREQGLFLSLYVDEIKMGGKEENHSLTMFIWVALNENAKQAKILWTTTGLWLNPGCRLKV